MLVLAAIVTACVALRRKARGLGDELKQGVVIFRYHSAYTRTVGFLETGSQQAMSVPILSRVGFPAG